MIIHGIDDRASNHDRKEKFYYSPLHPLIQRAQYGLSCSLLTPSASTTKACPRPLYTFTVSCLSTGLIPHSIGSRFRLQSSTNGYDIDPIGCNQYHDIWFPIKKKVAFKAESTPTLIFKQRRNTIKIFFNFHTKTAS